MTPRLPDIATHDGRRAWAFLAIVGGCMVFTVMAIVGVYLARNSPEYTFLLAVCAHIQVFLGTGAIGWAMGRRQLSKVSKDGAEFDDRPTGGKSNVDDGFK
jgi:hypothetical protein